MNSTATNLTIRMDRTVKDEADALFSSLGMNLSTAFNVFVRQAIRVQGMPFEIVRETPNAETVAAMREAERVAHDPKARRFKTVDALVKDLNS